MKRKNVFYAGLGIGPAVPLARGPSRLVPRSPGVAWRMRVRPLKAEQDPRASLWLFKIASGHFGEPLDVIARLAALVLKPKVNLPRFYGVFAPNSKRRAQVTPAKRGSRPRTSN